MPYITEEAKAYIDRQFSPRSAGELSYAITKVIKDYLWVQGTDYQHINDILGALEGAKLEFYRRVVVPYEEQKRISNGDVY